MTLAEILAQLKISDILTGSGIILIILLSCVEVSKVKLNPWSWVARKLGRALNGEMLEKIDNMDHKVNDLRNVCDEREATLRRTHILHFNDEILHEIKHTKEHFDQILEDIDYYEDYCDEHPDYKNNKAVCAINNIQQTYKKCMDEHSFL